MTGTAYYDSSALVKLVLEEADSQALRAYVDRDPGGASCALARVEVVRVARAYGPSAIRQAQASVDRFRLLDLDDELLNSAALLPAPVRTLDAIHLAAALSLGSELSALVTYDERMARAARELGLEVVSPR